MRHMFGGAVADTAELTFELLMKRRAEFAEFRRDQASIRMRLGSLEQHDGTIAGDIARINDELDHIRCDVSRIKQRLGLVGV